MTQLTKAGYNTVAKQILSPVILAVMMFALAGTTDWFWGWVFSVVHVLVWVLMSAVLIRKNPELLNARSRPHDNAKTWDKVILLLYGLNWISLIALGGLDQRYGWTSPLPRGLYLLGNALIVVGFLLTTWAMLANRNFEVAVRIQDDRGHQVNTGGPYQYVRHPGYTGVIIAFYLGMPLALGSWPAALMGLVGIVIMVIRTTLEDRTLHAELDGYAAFAQQTRYRLFPNLW
jgi:protein-S-isoprenylcysteine O-methyltransferase Ste14